jgi:trk system potassium uptake protein TrkA
MKSYVIIGLSSFGKYLAQFLTERNFYVIVIDSDESRVQEAKPFVSKGLVGNIKDIETLEKLGVQKADGVIVSLGEKVDDSMLLIYYLKQLGVENIYVKVISAEHAKIVELLGAVELIFPERESAFRLAQRIDNPNIIDYIPLTEGYSIVDWIPSESIVGKRIGELNLKNKYGIQVVSVEETLPERMKLIPRATHVIKKSDVLIVVGRNEDLERLKNLDK